MALTPWLPPVALLALCWGPSVAGAQGTVPMQTLHCHNDYTSHITCRWAATQDAQRLINVTLHRRLNEGPRKPVSCDLSDNMLWSDCPSLPCVPRKCVIPQKSFTNTDRDYFSFRPDRPLDTQLTIIPNQHVQPPAPQDLHVSAAGDQLLLTWSVALSASQNQWLSNLQFEVVYRRLQDSWEDAPTLYTTAPNVTLGQKQLMPSSTYVARVRTRLGPGSGLSGRPSQWSPEVLWDSPAGDKALPQNLQCFFDGDTVLSCSWEVRSEVTSSISFTLFYKSRPHAEGEQECSPVLMEKASGPYVRQRCHIPVPDPWNHSLYTISVRPKDEEKLIKSSDNIHLAPPTLNVTKGRDGYSLSWEVQAKFLRHIKHTFQVQYKQDTASWEESKTESLENTHIMSLPRLEPSTTYQARVRVRTHDGYNGIWSEWSKERSWDTEWVLPTWVLGLILVVTTLTLLLALQFCGTYGYRLNRKWEEKIPNPSKSQLFQNGSVGLWLPDSMAALTSRRPSHKGPWGSGFPGLEGVSHVDYGQCEVSPLTTEDLKCAHDSPSEPDPALAASDLPTEPPPSPQPCLSAPSSRPESQVSGFDFNGPYLGPPHSLSLPDLVGQEASTQMSMSLKPLPPGSLEYMFLPAAGQVQLVPLAQVMKQGQAAGVERKPCPEAKGSPSLESEAGPDPPAPGPMVGGQDPDSPIALPTASGGPEDSIVPSGYVTTADLALIPLKGASSASRVSPLGLPSFQNHCLPPGVTSAHPEVPAPVKSVDLPQSTGQSPNSPLGSLAA